MELSKNIKWTNDLEQYFKHIGEKAYSYSILHKLSEKKYSNLKQYIELPTIILTSISGTMSISSSSLFEGNEKTASVCIGFLSLFCGVLSTINTYYSFGKRTESHRISNIEYSKLFRFLHIEMKLPRHERLLPSDLLKQVKDNFERLAEISPLIDLDIIDTYKKKYNDKYDHIAKPSEVNGLEEIKIFVDDEKDIDEEEKEEIDPLKPISLNVSV